MKISSTYRPVYRHELVEVKIPANSTQTRYQLPDLPNLRNVHILGVTTYVSGEPMVNSALSNLPVIAYAVAQTAYLTLVNYAGKEFLKQAPFNIFKTYNNAAAGAGQHHDWDIKSFTGQKVNYPKSYIDFTAAPAVANDTVVLLSVWYSLPKNEEAADMAASFQNRS